MKRSFVDVINIFGVIIVIVVVVFAVYTLFIGRPFYDGGSYRVGLDFSDNDGSIIGSGEETGNYTAEKTVGTLEVGNISGRIEIEHGPGDLVQLEYVKRGPGQYPEVRINQNGDTLKIAAVYPKVAGNFGSVDFFLKVPGNVEYLEARSVSGGINVSGLGTAVQELSSTSGSVSTDSSGNLEISSVSGSLSFSSSGDEVSASTTSGRIDGRLETDPDSDSGRIDLSSVSGRILLEVPSDLNADIDLHSVSGSVSSDLPVSVTETKRNTIRGVIGSGGTDLEISTVSGAIKIKG